MAFGREDPFKRLGILHRQIFLSLGLNLARQVQLLVKIFKFLTKFKL